MCTTDQNTIKIKESYNLIYYIFTLISEYKIMQFYFLCNCYNYVKQPEKRVNNSNTKKMNY